MEEHTLYFEKDLLPNDPCTYLASWDEYTDDALYESTRVSLYVRVNAKDRTKYRTQEYAVGTSASYSVIHLYVLDAELLGGDYEFRVTLMRT